MIRKNIWTRALIGFLSLVLTAPVGAFAQPASNPQGSGAQPGFSQPKLDQMLAPIALYPDSLLAQVLLASTYPSRVVEANRWVKAHRGWSKARINAALDKLDWDLSVKALVPFPKVLAMMDKHLGWTTNLGEAFLGQQQQVMASVQELRHKAYAQGNLKTTPQQEVVVQRQDIEIEPVSPDVVYVPYYDPWLVYGDWWWPGYPPYAFFPYGGYGLFGFAVGISVGSYWNRGWGHWNWGRRDVFVNVDRSLNINDPRAARHSFRTANFNSFAHHRAAGLGRVPGARAGAFNRPSAASVRQGLSSTGTRAGSAHGFGAQRPGFAGNRPANGSFGRSAAGAHGHGFVGGAHNFNGAGNFRSNGFAGSHPGHVAPGFAGHGVNGGGFRGPVGGAPAFGGGGAHIGGGAPHFGGGGAFGGGGGGAHFGGGGGGAHFGGGGGGAHFGGGGGGAHFGGGGRR
ncbi:MAG: DUF3300 domain-containing protein [Syntrophobacteraceae bacterium]|nr:DUF3300 domain-containing protein [Syntrophobacteraceae bacterium]